MSYFKQIKGKARAWLVHLYTGLGLMCGFMALYAMVTYDARLAFFWLGIALVIDATDGTFARKFNIKHWTPGFDGRKLDDITDYLNYAFLPVFFIWRFELITGSWFFFIPVVLLASVYGFCQSDAKTDDGYFTGFPNFWNLVALYLFTFQWPVFINGIIMVILAFLIFVPFKFVSFSTPGKVKLAKSLSGIYFVLLIIMAINSSLWIAIISLIFPILYFGYALYLRINHSEALLSTE
jgi:phosphatidylcholine synthase